MLTAPRGAETRPTSDRLRETLFNILAAARASGIEGTRFVDLYAGTGAVGIEAASRGAAQERRRTARSRRRLESRRRRRR